METISLTFLILAGLLLLLLLLVLIPEGLGQKTGNWVVSRLFPSWPPGRRWYDELPPRKLSAWWLGRWGAATFIALATTQIVFDSLVPEAPNLPSAPYLIATSLQEQQLQRDPVHLMIYGILLATSFFIIGFVSNFLSSWHRFTKKKQSISDPASEKIE